MQNDITNIVTMLQEAKRLNNDLGHHVRRASFSTHLSGRFYQNNSLGSYKARSNRVSKMKAERRKLEKFLELEEKKIKFLEERLYEHQMERRREEEKRMIETLSCIKVQSIFRRFSAYNKLQLLRVERDIKVYVILWLQSIFRGNRDRCIAQKLKCALARQRKEALSSIQIQTKMRQIIAKRRLSEKRQKYMIRRHNAARTIQALLRGHHGRRETTRRRQEFASIEIQRIYRGFLGRKLREKRRKKKTKRIPLHERRYSSYGAAVTVEISRRGSISTKNTINGMTDRKRRASLPGWDVLRKAVGTEAAKVRAPLKPVVDRIPSRCTPINQECSSVQSKATTSTKSSSKLQRNQKKMQRKEKLKVNEVLSDGYSITLDSVDESNKARGSSDIASTSNQLSDESSNLKKEEEESDSRNHSTPLEKSSKLIDSIKENRSNVEEDGTDNQEKSSKTIDASNQNESPSEAQIIEHQNHTETADSILQSCINVEEDEIKIQKSYKPLNSIQDKAITVGEDRPESRHHSMTVDKSSKSAESIQEKRRKISSTYDNSTQNSRKSVTKRALEISRKKKAEKEAQKQKQLDRKAELQKLEEARRSKMKQEIEERKERKAAKMLLKKKNDQSILPIVDVKSEGKMVKKKDEICSSSTAEDETFPNENNKLLVISQHIVIDESFLDGPFELNCTETEYDLD